LNFPGLRFFCQLLNGGFVHRSTFFLLNTLCHRESSYHEISKSVTHNSELAEIMAIRRAVRLMLEPKQFLTA
jgi:hypothetical protein